MPIIRPCHPQFAIHDVIIMDEAQEITFDILEILLDFRIFLIFLQNPQILETAYLMRYITFKVEDMYVTNIFRI